MFSRLATGVKRARPLKGNSRPRHHGKADKGSGRCEGSVRVCASVGVGNGQEAIQDETRAQCGQQADEDGHESISGDRKQKAALPSAFARRKRTVLGETTRGHSHRWAQNATGSIKV